MPGSEKHGFESIKYKFLLHQNITILFYKFITNMVWSCATSEPVSAKHSQFEIKLKCKFTQLTAHRP